MTEMTDCQREKRAFVSDCLTGLLRACTHGDVAVADYQVEGCEEFVRVTFANGFRKRACVTGDSLRAMAEDVLAIV